MEYRSRLSKWYDRGGFKYLLAKLWIHLLGYSFMKPFFIKILTPLYHEKLLRWFEIGYYPHIKNPRSFNEKILHRKLFTDNDLFTLVEDKYAVREYVKERVNEDVLPELYYVTDDPNEIPFDRLPDKFVIKPNHGSGWYKFIHSNEDFNTDQLISRCEMWLSQTYGTKNRQWWYWDIDPKIIIEEFIKTEENEVPIDYKFFVFNGNVEYIQVDIDRFSKHKRRIYSKNWTPLDFQYIYPLAEPTSEPEGLSEMISVAEKLGRDFGFVRVDLYNPKGNTVKFGELTVGPESGSGRFYPTKADFKIGRHWGAE